MMAQRSQARPLARPLMSEPADHPKRDPHAAIEALVPQARAVAQVLDQVILLARRRGDAHHAPAVDDLLVYLLACPRLDAYRRLSRLVRGGTRGRGWRLRQRFELGRLLRRERQRDDEERRSENSAQHDAEISLQGESSRTAVPSRRRGRISFIVSVAST